MLGDGKPQLGVLVAPSQAMGPSMGPSLLPRMLQWKAAALGWESPESTLQMGCPVSPETLLLALTLVFSCLSSHLGAGPRLGSVLDENKSWLHGEWPS